MQHIVYLTRYKGTKLPEWYIGSTSHDNILNGYNGSVSSKKYKKIYLEEQKHNKHLFKTRILSRHMTRKDAIKEELRLQEKHKVTKNPKYINMSYARPDGYFGLSICGEEHPQFGTKHDEDFCRKISVRQSGKKNSFFGKTHSKESKDGMREKLSGDNNPFYGGKHTQDALKKIKDKSGTCKGTSYVYNAELSLCRRVKHSEREELLSKGWKIGRKVFDSNKKIQKIFIYNIELMVNRKIYPIELQEFLDKGWKKGKYNFSKMKKRTKP